MGRFAQACVALTAGHDANRVQGSSPYLECGLSCRHIVRGVVMLKAFIFLYCIYTTRTTRTTTREPHHHSHPALLTRVPSLRTQVAFSDDNGGATPVLSLRGVNTSFSELWETGLLDMYLMDYFQGNWTLLALNLTANRNHLNSLRKEYVFDEVNH